MTSEHRPIRIVIADDQAIYRRSLRRILESTDGLQVLGDVSDTSLAIKLAHRLKPDLLLFDLALCRQSAPQVLNGFASHVAPVRIVAMVAAIEKSYIVDAFRLGAHGIILRTAPPDVLVRSIRTVMTGRYWLDSESVAMLVDVLRESLAEGNGNTSPKDYGLTPRELEIIAKIAIGRSNRQVGEEFSISERTVKHHLTNIFTKIGVSSRLQLALFAVNHRLMSDHVPAVELDGLQPDGEL
jgi:two-component system nitrate/nitrite response regulator NarL